MIVVGVGLYTIVLPVLVLWFVQARLPKPPTEFELLCDRVRGDIERLAHAIGTALLPAITTTIAAAQALIAAYERQAKP